MCKNCYLKTGRVKKAEKCIHSDLPLYAKGLCKKCYQSVYTKTQREKKKTTQLHANESVMKIDPNLDNIKIIQNKITEKQKFVDENELNMDNVQTFEYITSNAIAKEEHNSTISNYSNFVSFHN